MIDHQHIFYRRQKNEDVFWVWLTYYTHIVTTVAQRKATTLYVYDHHFLVIAVRRFVFCLFSLCSVTVWKWFSCCSYINCLTVCSHLSCCCFPCFVLHVSGRMETFRASIDHLLTSSLLRSFVERRLLSGHLELKKIIIFELIGWKPTTLHTLRVKKPKGFYIFVFNKFLFRKENLV